MLINKTVFKRDWSLPNKRKAFLHEWNLACIRAILTRAWAFGNRVKRQYDVGLSISVPASQPRLLEINKICLAFGPRGTQSVYILLKTSLNFNLFNKSKVLLKWVLISDNSGNEAQRFLISSLLQWKTKYQFLSFLCFEENITVSTSRR